MKITLPKRIIAYLAKNGPSTIAQVTAALGRYVTAAQAQRAWEVESRARLRKRGPTHLLCKKRPNPQSSGRNVVVRDRLIKLYKEGKLERLGHGIYGPAAPSKRKVG